ncbi:MULTISPECIES: M1 family metallopeptidase [unclassified Amycolatopsis]|uniref:M1 family metallopeptidase n=1 Tax=unclassified Amycolatopsis TaxID=2618356 RepID=UPI002875F0F3|nr:MULTISPECIES: M1 family metallopeptidase [unclassified Amycolatopsis]MDS0133646.1 M1 family metallopeptidase [Amycolatopsis sp. 505]MDS0148509.1 M1 family metallopeptidase [Amycolatopsis sp. CM201R]
MRGQKPVVVAAAVVASLCLGTGVAAAGDGWGAPKPGSDGAGDSYYPQDGNGGYDVADYNLKVTYDPASHQLTGNQDIAARATQALSSFNLDFKGLTVDSIEVDGRDAKFSRTGDHELVVTPSRALWRGQHFKVKIAYHGVPAPISDPSLGNNGWQFAQAGGAFVAGEPRSATTWYPVNDTPLDKATFHLAITVPDEWGVIANGREKPSIKTPNGTTHVWAEETPIVPYMTTVAIDKWTFDRQKRKDGTPIVSAFAPGVPDSTKQAEARLPEILDFLESKFGKYPIDAAGGIFLNEQIGFSLETMSRPIYSAGWAGTVPTIVHENAHQWYGDSVAVAHWRDVCLNECFASYATWLWDEAKEGVDLNAQYANDVKTASTRLWNGKLYDMGQGNEFTYVYSKGPMMLHALRNYIGEQAFSWVLKTWPSLHRDGNASMQEFQRFTEFAAHRSLQGFFDAWVYGSGKPADQYLYPGGLKPAA